MGVIVQFSHLTAKEMCPKEIMFYINYNGLK